MWANDDCTGDIPHRIVSHYALFSDTPAVVLQDGNEHLTNNNECAIYRFETCVTTRL